MKPNKWKITGLVVATWLIFSTLAKGMLIVQEKYIPGMSMLDTQPVVWSWMSLFMGIFMGLKFKKWGEFRLGVVFFIVCLLPFLGVLAGIYYFALSYYKLGEKDLPKTLKPERERASNKISSIIVSDKLSDIFIDTLGSPDKLHKFKKEFLIQATDIEAYFCLSSLYFLSFIRVSESGNIKLSPEIIEKISHNLASFLITKYLVLYKVDDNENTLLMKQNEITQHLIQIWDKNIHKEPAPHWCVAKEICFILSGRNEIPDVALMTALGGFLSNDTIMIKKIFDELTEKFIITE